MAEKPDINPTHLKIVTDILHKILPQDVTVWVFGSRAKWTAKEFSDLDLALEGKNGGKIPTDIIARLDDDFEESDLPWKVDVVDINAVAPGFREIIENDRVKLDRGRACSATQYKFSDIIGLVTNKIQANRITAKEYISTDNMKPNLGGVEFATQLPSANKFNSFNVGDTLFSNIRTYFRKVWQAEFGGGASADVLIFRTKDEEILLADYLYYLVANQEFIDFTDKTSKGAKMPRGDKSAIQGYEFYLPSKEIQNFSAKTLKALDDKIELNQRMNKTLEEMAQAIFKCWFVDFEPTRAKIAQKEGSGESDADICTRLKITPKILSLFPDTLTDSELGKIPEGWEEKPLKELCMRVESGGTPKRAEPSYWNGEVKWLSSGEVRENIVLDTKEYISDLGLGNSSAKLWPTYSTVVAMYGATAGQVCLIASDMTANQACCCLIPKQSHEAFIYIATQNSVEDLAGKASGSAQQNLNKGLVESHNVTSPCTSLIEAYNEVCMPFLFKQISNLRMCLSLAQIRDTLLPKLLSGEIFVGEAENIVEGV